MRDWQRERERRWFPDVRRNSESYRVTPLLLFLLCTERDLNYSLRVIMERIEDGEEGKRRGSAGGGEPAAMPAEGKEVMEMRKGMETMKKTRRRKTSRASGSDHKNQSVEPV